MKSKKEVFAYLEHRYPHGIHIDDVFWVAGYTGIKAVSLARRLVALGKIDHPMDIDDFKDFYDYKTFRPYRVKSGADVKKCDECEYKKNAEKDNAPKPKFKVGDLAKTKAHEKIRLCGLYETVIKAGSVVKILQIEDAALMQDGVESKTFQYLVKNGDDYGRCNEKDLESAENNDPPFELDIPKPKFHRGDRVKVKGGADVMTVAKTQLGYSIDGCVHICYELKNALCYINRNEEDLELVKAFHDGYADSKDAHHHGIHDYSKEYGDKPKGNSYKCRNEDRRALKRMLGNKKKALENVKEQIPYLPEVIRILEDDIARIEKMLEERV